MPRALLALCWLTLLCALAPSVFAVDDPTGATTTAHMHTITKATDANAVLAAAQGVKDYVVNLRRQLHRSPELMWREHGTRDVITRELTALGISYEYVSATGVVGTIGTGAKAVGLRADMDALPLTEATASSYKSEIEGVMHACGHDGHVSMLLGAAKILKAKYDADPETFPGVVRLIFQPAEEGGAGAKEMLAPSDGSTGLLMMKPELESVFGLHNWPYPEMPSGTMGTRGGTIMAGSGCFDVNITGRGGHAAVPHNNVDVVVAGSAVVTALQTLVSRLTDPLDSVVISVTVFNAGSASNVMADSANLQGTLRALNPKTFIKFQDKIVEMVQAVAAAHGCTASTSFEPEWNGVKRIPYPPTVNDAKAAALAMRVASDMFGEESIKTVVPVMPAEDFSFFGEVFPSVMMWLGAYNATAGATHPLHSTEYVLDENVLTTGVALHALYALEYLRVGI
jgi:IAA-amino acid hydrolase